MSIEDIGQTRSGKKQVGRRHMGLDFAVDLGILKQTADAAETGRDGTDRE